MVVGVVCIPLLLDFHVPNLVWTAFLGAYYFFKLVVTVLQVRLKHHLIRFLGHADQRVEEFALQLF